MTITCPEGYAQTRTFWRRRRNWARLPAASSKLRVPCAMPCAARTRLHRRVDEHGAGG